MLKKIFDPGYTARVVDYPCFHKSHMHFNVSLTRISPPSGPQVDDAVMEVFSKAAGCRFEMEYYIPETGAARYRFIIP